MPRQCLSKDEVKALLHGSASDVELDSMTTHVGACTTCQDSLEKEASGQWSIEQLVSDSSTNLPPKQSAYWDAIQALKAPTDITQPPDVAATFVSNKPALSFLQPSDDPAYLGRLDHFLIARIIGRGGMGIVLEAFDTHLARQVALKVLNPEFAKNDTARQRFCREGRAAAAIAHEHVVAMYQVSRETEGTVAYLVMQLIDGVTLESLLTEGHPLPIQEAARIGMQIAAGLSAAHARGMVHRDIKPANILIEKDTNRVKITDFGLARASDDVKLTKSGMVTGTPLYMSPEQAMGSAADERSDLFSFGAVLYEMVTGISPFQAPSMVGVMKRVMDETPVAPHELNPSVCKALSKLIMSMLSKKPEDRPESAVLVASALAAVVSEFGPISPLQVPAVAANDLKKLSGKHTAVEKRRSVLLAGAMGVLLLSFGIGLGWFMSGTFNRKQDEAFDDAKFPSTLMAGNPGTVWSVDFVPNQNKVVAAVEDGSVRVWDIDQKKLLKSFNAHRGIIWMVQFHPTKPLVASSGDDGWVKLWNADTFQLIREFKAFNAVRGLAFSPDGQNIAFGDRDGVIHVYRIDDGVELNTKTQTGSIFGIDYSADGKMIATVGTDKLVHVWDAATLEERQSFSGHDGPIYNVDFAPQGYTLATVGWGRKIHVWDAETGQKVVELEGSQGDVWGVSFCDAGSHLVTSGQEGVTRIWDVSAGKQVARLSGHESSVHNVSLDPINHRIATSGRDGNIRVWDVSSLVHP